MTAENLSPPTDLIDTDEARKLLGNVSRETLEEVVSTGVVYQYRITPRVVRYSRGEVLRYLTTHAAAAGKAACEAKLGKRRGRPRKSA